VAAGPPANCIPRATGIWKLVLLGTLVLGAGCFPAHAAFVSETSNEFLTSGDFNGDGLPDVLVLDKLTGNARIGYQGGSGELTWAAAFATGADPATALAVGRFAQTNRDDLAVTAAGLNSVRIVSLPGSSNVPTASVIHPPHAGVTMLVGLDAPYGATAERSWLTTGAVESGLTLLDLLGFDATGQSFFQDQVPAAGALRNASSFRRAAGDATLLAAIRADGSNDTFVAFAYTNTAAPALVRSNLPTGVQYVFGQFNNDPLPHLIFYVPGQSNVIAQPLLATGTDFALGPATLIELGAAVGQVWFVPEPTNGLVVVRFGDGAVSGLHLAAGDDHLTLAPGLAIGPTGDAVSGVVPLEPGRFVLLVSWSNLLASTSARVFTLDVGGNYVQTASNALPAVSSAATRGNVWWFPTDPFVAGSASLVASFSAPVWSSRITYAPDVAVRVETDGGAVAGLGNPGTNQFGSLPPGANYALPNQYRDDVSFFGYGPARAAEPSLVTISPPPGPYTGPIQIGFSTSGVGDDVYFRTGASGAWQRYLAAFGLTNSATIEYYGSTPAGARSRSQLATYTLASSTTTGAPPVTLPGGETNPPPPFETNLVQLSARGTVFYSRHTVAAELQGPQGPSPYLSFADSPFAAGGYDYFYLEDFEDGLFNQPGATVNTGWVVAGPSVNTDSVDADDGSINGSGAGGHSFYSGGTQTNLTITFDAAALGGHLPTHAGVVFTDVGVVLSGVVGYGNVLLTARGAGGEPLGASLGVNLGDGAGGAATAEDRFFGVVNPGGISSISLTLTNSRDWEVDHIQFGYLADFNDTIWAINLDGSGETFITAGARPRLDRDAQHLVFLRGGGGVTTEGDLWTRELATGQESLRVINTNEIQAVDWAGTNLVFDENCALWSGPVNGPFTMLPPALTPECYNGAPVVNPVNGQLAFQNLNPGGTAGVYLTPPDWSARARIAEPGTLRLRWPAWSPDGTRLLMADQPTSAFLSTGVNLWTANADGSGLRQITALTGTDGFPHSAIWTPDGRAIVGAGTIGGTNGLWVIPLESDGGACHCPPRRLPTTAGSDIDFAGSILAATAPPAGPRPDLFIRSEPDLVAVYWSTNYQGYALEASSDAASGDWSAIAGPYYLVNGNYEYREAKSALAATKFFRLHYPGVIILTP